MSDILITENITGAPVDELCRMHDVALLPDLWEDQGAVCEAVRTARALIVRNQTRVTAGLIESAPRLEIIARAGVGLDNVDVQAASKAGIVVAYTPSQNSISVAELAIGLMLSLARHIPAADRHVKQGGWSRYEFMGSELFGKTLGVVGFGRIGFLTARRAAAFGMEVVVHDPYVDRDAPMLADLRARSVGFDELLDTADVVTCHLPCSDETRAIFDYARFARMKPTAIFINVARGEVVDEKGLVKALTEGKIAGAALDVRQKEPPQAGPLCKMDNVILVPHIGAFTHEGQRRVVASVCRDVAAILAGRPAANYVNFPWPRSAG